MNAILQIVLIGAACLAAVPALAQAATPPSPQASPPTVPTPPAPVPGPDVRVKVTDDYAALVARDAYFWAWPMVNVYNRRLAFAQVSKIVTAGPAAVGAAQPPGMLTDYVDPAERLVACPNQDVVYGLGSLALDRLAGGDAGARFRRPLLGLSGGRPAHRQLRAARQDVRHQAGLLPAGRSQLEGRGAEGHHQGVPLPRPTPASSRRASSRTIRRRTRRAIQSRPSPGS